MFGGGGNQQYGGNSQYPGGFRRGIDETTLKQIAHMTDAAYYAAGARATPRRRRVGLSPRARASMRPRRASLTGSAR